MRLLSLRWASPVAFALAVACGDSDTPGDAGTTDATPVVRMDAQPVTDTGVPPADTGVPPADTGVVDGSAPDAELPADATADAGVIEDAAIDGGTVPTDGGTPVPAAPVIHSFSAAGHDRLFGAAFDADDNLVAVGVTSNGTISPDLETIVVRFLPDGTLDPSFGTNGVFRRNLVVGGTVETGRGIVIQSDGRIVISAAVEAAGAADARDSDVALVRLTRTGTIDASFGTAGVAIHSWSAGAAVGNGFATDAPWGLAVDADDTLVLQGSAKNPARNDTDYVVAKYTARGAVDATFGTGGLFWLDIDNQNASSRNPTVLADGSILGAGYMTVSGVTTPVIFKLTAGGVLDTTFAGAGVFTTAVLSSVTEAYAAAPQSTGALVTAGYGREEMSATNDYLSLRLSAAGALDTTYGSSGAGVVDIGGFADNCRDLVVLPDDRVVLVGNGRVSASNNEGAVVVLTSSGTPDLSFGANGTRTFELGGPADAFWDVARASDGRLGIVGLRGAVMTGGNDDAVVLFLAAP